MQFCLSNEEGWEYSVGIFTAELAILFHGIDVHLQGLLQLLLQGQWAPLVSGADNSKLCFSIKIRHLLLLEANVEEV